MRFPPGKGGLMPLPIDQCKNLLENSLDFSKRCGFKVLELEKGYVKAFMPIVGNNNHIGTMYAGALFTLAEMPGGALYLTSFDTDKFYPIVKDMYLKFVAPAATDITAEYSLTKEEITNISKEAEEVGKAEFILSGELKDAEGKVVAISKGVYQIRKF